MPATLTHRDHLIKFDEATETWLCGDLGLSDKSLAKLKKAVERAAKKMRTVKVTALLVYPHWSDDRIKEVTITLLRQEGRKAHVEWTDPDGDTRAEQVELSHLFPPDKRKAIAAYIVKRQAAGRAEAIADAAWGEIEQFAMTAERIREIVVQQAEEKS